MIRKLLFTSIVSATAVTAIPAMAQSGQAAIEEIQVVSTSRRSEGLAEVNASVAVLSEEELQLVGHTHYQEALNRLPGVNIQRGSGQESLAAIRSAVLTGAGACGEFLVAEQGIPVRANGFCNVNEMFDTHSENADQIEVIRGPGSAFYGSNAVHGMINVLLPEPGDRAEIGIETGPRGFARVRGAFGHDYGNFKQLVLVNGINEEGWRDDSGVDQQKFSWLYQYTTDNNLRLDGGFTTVNLNQETAGYVVGPDAYKDSSLQDTNPNPDAYRDSKSTRAWTSISAEMNGWDVVLTPYFRDVNMTFIQHFLPGTPTEDTNHQSFGFQFAAYQDLVGDATFAWGIDAETTDGGLKQFQPNPMPAYRSAFLRNTLPQGLHYDYDVEARQSAVFMNYERDNGDWDLSLGLRYERVSYDYTNNGLDGRTKQDGIACRFGGCRYSRPADRDDSFGDWSPKLGLSYAINDNHSAQIRVQRGFRAPQATEMYRLQNGQTVAELDSVELDSYEFGFTGTGNNWDYSATVYFMDKENEILTNSSRETLNGNHTQHQGIEFAAGYDISSSLTFRGTFNFAGHTYENSQISGGIDIKGNELDSAPSSFGNLRLQWRVNADLFTELEMMNMGEYYTNPENTADYGGHSIFNLRTQYRISDDLDIALNILNLTNKDYAERADWTSFGGDRYFTGELARAFLSLNWKL
jgi:outer membrane receptor protein involved in Fe transport